MEGSDPKLTSRLEAVLETAPDATVVSDRLGRIVLANTQAETLFGYAPGALAGLEVEALIPPRFRAAHPGHRHGYFRDPRPRSMGAGRLELVGLRKDGTEFPAEISLSPLETEDGIFAVTAIRDVTARRRVESKFRGLLEAAPDAMVIADARGRIVLVNAQAERLFGYPREELLGQLVEALIPARFRGTHRGHRTAYVRDPRARPMGAGGLELRGLRRDGSEFPAEISLSPLETEEGTLAITAIRDVSERHRAEAERAQLHARLEQLVADQGRFFTNVSHELRTPLALILGPVQRLLEAAPAGPARADLEVIERNARTLRHHVDELLELARLEAGGLVLQAGAADAAGLLRLVASHFSSLAAERGVGLAVEAPEALPAVLDAPKLQRVLLNLISNAFKFTPDGGRIRCALRAAAGPDEPEGGLVLEVADSGPGVRPADREAVFLRFRQAEGAGAAGGTGLGLTIARELVELHGGRISVDEAPEGGARFRVVLPARPPTGAVAPPPSPEEVRDVAEALRPRPPPAEAPRREDAPVVLVVEDHPDMRAHVREVLSPVASVALAASGREGLERAAALRPDLIVTDLMMPDGSGEALLAGLRARPALAEVPVLVLTAVAAEEVRLRLLRQGAQDYLLKPFTAEELRLRVEGLLASGRARALLRRELDSHGRELDVLARDLAARTRDLQGALEAARLARDEADQASRIKGNFLALVSHELRTPVTVLLLQAERLLRVVAQDERGHGAAASMLGATRRLAALIDTLLEQSRVASGQVALRWERTGLSDLVAAAVEPLRAEAEQKRLSLRIQAAPDLPPVVTDPRLLRVVVENLVGNAVKFTAAGGVLVAVSGGEGLHRVDVDDTGGGIAEADRERIFQPFVQLDPVHAKHLPGVGLGLALVRELCAAIGARVELESRVGVGSRFSVLLPEAPSERPAFALGAPVAKA